MKLAEMTCNQKEGGKTLSLNEAEELTLQVPAWSPEGKEIQREFQFKDFRHAIGFVNEVADVAEEQGHHPDIFIYYDKVRLTLSTHKIGGLSRNDFILAAKIDLLIERLK